MFIVAEVIFVLVICGPLLLRSRKSRSHAGGGNRGMAAGALASKIVAGTLILAIVAWNVYLGQYVGWHWFDSKGYADVFRRMIGLRWGLFTIGFLLSFALVFANLRLAFWTVRRKSNDTELALVIALGAAAVMGGVLSSLWTLRLMSRHQTASELVDPIFGRSLSHYLFSLPWRQGLLAWVLGLVVITFLAVLITFLVPVIARRARKKARRGGDERSHTVIVSQLFALAAVWALVLAIQQGLNVDRLLFSTDGVVVGAGYTDLHARLFGIRASRVVWILAALVLLASAIVPVRRRMYLTSGGKTVRGRIIGVPVVFIGLLVLFNAVIPGLQQATRVAPNELEAEMPYIEHNLRFTRMAYSIGPGDIEERSIRIGREITPEVIRSNRGTLASIRLWDYRALKDYLREHQEIKPYYEFHDVDIDRYDLDGVRREVMLAVRELDTEQLDDRARTWMNRTFKYTHGYGLTMAPVNEFLSGGKPNLLIKNIPPEAQDDVFSLTRPQIYYGELTDTNILTTPAIDEFDYPAGEENAYNNYDGEGGIPLDTDWKKLCFAWRLNAHQMLFSPDVDHNTRVHMHRGVSDMVRRIAPWLRYDSDPYAVIVDGGIKWIQDAYTVSSYYPYSAFYTGDLEDYAGINYIAAAVKIVIDAYDGTVDFYVLDQEDPVIRTFQNAFPSLLKPASAMPPEIHAHLRYPEDLFTIQMEMYGTYQMRNTQVFYTKEDVWQRPREKYNQSDDAVVEPYYITATLPNSTEPQFILMSPYTPREKNVLRSWICAASDGPNYGRLTVYKFPKGEEIKGPRMVESRIDQDSDISQVLTLWDQKGSQVLRGNLMVVPLFHQDEAYLLYVEPIYLQAEGAKMPELKKIVVADQERIVWGDTFQAALEDLVGTGSLAGMSTGKGSTSAVEGFEGEDPARALRILLAALERYRELLGAGRFSEAGDELERIYELAETLGSGD